MWDLPCLIVAQAELIGLTWDSLIVARAELIGLTWDSLIVARAELIGLTQEKRLENVLLTCRV